MQMEAAKRWAQMQAAAASRDNRQGSKVSRHRLQRREVHQLMHCRSRQITSHPPSRWPPGSPGWRGAAAGPWPATPAQRAGPPHSCWARLRKKMGRGVGHLKPSAQLLFAHVWNECTKKLATTGICSSATSSNCYPPYETRRQYSQNLLCRKVSSAAAAVAALELLASAAAWRTCRFSTSLYSACSG